MSVLKPYIDGGKLVVNIDHHHDNGRYGERIRARNLQSEKVIEVTVTGPGEGET